MKDANKTKEQLMSELAGLRQQIVELERSPVERRWTSQELVHLERLHVLGKMAAGFSHNLNNILSTLLAPAQLLKRNTDDPHVLQEVEDIVESALRARDLVQSFHQIVRNGKEDSPHPVWVDKVVQAVVRATQPRWRDESVSRGISIEVITRLEGISPIHGTEDGLYNILVNLLFNAVDAMPEGGIITIATQALGEKVQMMVTDTGTGMDEETCRHVFDPFFTTRKEDGGTGLGLSTVYDTVTRWGGTISVESTPGRGTSFILQFPVWQGAKGG